MDEALAKVSKALAKVTSRPVATLSDEALIASIVDTYAFLVQLNAAIAALEREARSRELQHRKGHDPAVGARPHGRIETQRSTSRRPGRMNAR